MKMLNVITLIASCLFCLNVHAGVINYLSPDFYGFEDGGTAFWIQNSEWSISDEQAADGSHYSIKFSSAEKVDGQKKAHGGSNDSGISLKKGSYTIKLKVWVDKNSEVSGFNFTLKEPWTNFAIQIDTMSKEKWVDVSFEYTFEDDVNHSGSLLTVAPTNGGKGVFYVDDIQIWGEGVSESQQIPAISTITATGDANISLPSGIYEVKMNVWVEENTTISKFYSQINQPCVSMEWSIADLTPNKWVTVSQKMTLSQEVNHSSFSLFVNNNPELGGGVGAFFIDDIRFEYQKPSAINGPDGFDFKVYPNPATEGLTIESGKTGNLKIFNIRGNLVKEVFLTSSKLMLRVSDLKSGIYLVQMTSENGSVVRPILIQ